jgi:hypothetical protein
MCSYAYSNELNELNVSYSRAYRVEPSFKYDLVMLTRRAKQTRCFNELKQSWLELAWLGLNSSPIPTLAPAANASVIPASMALRLHTLRPLCAPQASIIRLHRHLDVVQEDSTARWCPLAKLAAIAEGRLRRGYSKTLAKLNGKAARTLDGATIAPADRSIQKEGGLVLHELARGRWEASAAKEMAVALET